MSGLAARVALVALTVSALTVAIVAVGVLAFGASAFERLMVEHGETVATSRAMFDGTVRTFLIASAAVAVVASLILASLLAYRLSRPLSRIAAGARRVAVGDLHVRVPAEGPAEIASVAESFNQMADRLEEQERLRSEFIANAAHELSTPLTNLVGYLEALRDDVVAPSRETFVSLREEVERLVRLSRSLQALAEGDLAGAAARPVDLDLVTAINDATEIVQPSFDRRGISLAVDVPPSLRARADQDQLSQVLANLLQNAVRYTPEGGRVAIAARPRTKEVVVTVSNTGDGIPARDIPRVFERFFRVERSRDRARGGAGIGLTIVKQIVERAGGRVGAESSEGTTRFWFSLPAGDS